MKKSFISFLATLTLTPMTLVTIIPTVSCSLKSIDARINALPDTVEIKDVDDKWWVSHDLGAIIVYDIVIKIGLQINEAIAQIDISDPGEIDVTGTTAAVDITVEALEGKGTASKTVKYNFTKKVVS
ncbi:hypothetical protein [Spiroplasma endosymbiont of Eupeodes luniger]|uniref:hypothetical protein n=1 Tax=Spiroplasma endosymbiont of Eupeodes luniger TaxID=3066300 RepID=UPI0030CB0FEA